MGQKVLVIGSGAREHTIAYTLLKARALDEVTVAANSGHAQGRHHTTRSSASRTTPHSSTS